MDDRVKKLKRLVAVQRQIEQVAEIDLAETTRERRRLGERMDSVMTAMTSPDPIHAGFSKHYSLQLAHLKTKDQQMIGRSRLQEQRVLAEKAKADRLEEHMERAASLAAREAADEAVYDILDCLDNFTAQASRKLHDS